MEKITKFVECLLPITLCNLKCHYCYVIQRHNRLMEKAVFDYPISTIIEALSPQRFGGIVYFSICGAGETMLCKELPELVNGLLKYGHYVNITTNGTCTFQLKKMMETINEELLPRLHFSFSYHYLELKRLKLNDSFFENIQIVRDHKCSFMVQVNLCDEYIPIKDKIIEEVESHTGARPQLAATRKENDLKKNIVLFTNLSEGEYLREGEDFQSPLFDFTMKNFNVKRKEFCYAGAWSYVLNLGTGILQACYASKQRMNIYKNPHRKIHFMAIGRHCPSGWCMNSSHFLSLGVIPELETPSYAALRDRLSSQGHWLSNETREAFSHKLSEVNNEYGFFKKVFSEFIFWKDEMVFCLYRMTPQFLKNLIRKSHVSK